MARATRRTSKKNSPRYLASDSREENDPAIKWITRNNVKVDRVACPWLITRFVDPAAEFLFVPEDQLLAAARDQHATPFDATRLPAVKLNHRGTHCTFESILEEFGLTDPALRRLGQIVRAADVKGQEGVAVEGLGLQAIAEGFALTRIVDAERLARQFPMYDALYAYCWRNHGPQFYLQRLWRACVRTSW